MSFLNVKILPELFHLDIELLQMIFSITSMLQAALIALISTVLFMEHSIFPILPIGFSCAKDCTSR